MNNSRTPVHGTTSQNVGAGMLSFVTPFIILIAMFTLGGIAPFGENTLLCEHNAQWFSDLAQWRSVLEGDAGLMYSFAGGLGGDFYSRWADGLCSPFLLIMLAMEPGMLPQAFAVTILVRAAFAGLFCFLLLRRLSGRTPMSAAAFATAYASGSQFFLSFLAPQYADTAVLLPLAAAGIALLAEKGRATLFFCGASLYLLCCGRMWPLLVFFSIVYFVWCQLVLGIHEGLWARLGLFITSLAAAVGAAMITLIPCFSLNSSVSSAVTPVNKVDSAGFFDMAASMFSGMFTDGTIMPLLFCSTMTILMVPLYVMNRRLPLGERQVCLFFLLLLMISMCVPVLCWLWLGFSVPSGTVTGCGCVFCLFAVSAAVRLTAQPMRIKVSKVLLSWIIAAGLFLAALIFGSVEYSFSSIIFAGAFLTMYAAITIIALSGRGISMGFCLVILVCMGCESVLGGLVGLQAAAQQLPLVSAAQQQSQLHQLTDVDSIIAGSELQNSDTGFFRVRGAYSSGAGQVDAASTLTPECSQLMDVLGISDGKGFTPVTDSLFGVKYTMSESPIDSYDLAGITGSLNIHRNRNAMGLCVVAHSGVQAQTSFSTNPFTAQNELISAMTNAERKLFVDASLTGREGDGVSIIETLDGIELVRNADSGSARFSVLVPTDGPLYMYLGCQSSKLGNISVNGSEPRPIDLDAINLLGRFTRGTQITVTLPVEDERLSVRGTWFAVLDTALTDTALEQLARQSASYINVRNSTVTCTATVSEGQILMTSIPWQEGWRAFVNGVETDTVRVSGALLGVDTGAGVHDVRLVYEPTDFTVCLIISVVFILTGLLLTSILDSDRLRRIYENRQMRARQAKYEMPDLPPQEDIFATYSSYMIPDIQSLDDQEDDFSDYFNGM